MNLNRVDGISLVEQILNKLPDDNKTDVVFAPSFIHLYKIAKMCAISDNILVSSQDCSANEKGAFTGEVSAEMVASCGAKYIILGHSERRIHFSETNELLKTKVEHVFANNLDLIFCCGESLEQRQGDVHFDFIKSQISDSLFHLSSLEFCRVVIAYEPIWAIGTGITSRSDQAQEMHAFIRSVISEKYGDHIAEAIPILYGGSCKPSNSIELFSQKDIDGGLIGGASLDADNFIQITQSF